MRNNENGRSMIEMLGVLAIIGVLSVGGIAGYSKAMSKYRVNKTIDQISHIAANTRILFSSQKSYAAITDDVIYKAKLFPQETMKLSGSTYTFTNPFAGGIEMSPAARFDATENGTEKTNKKAFMLKYDGIPQEACIDLATIDWGTGSGGGLVAMGVNKTVESATAGGCTGGAQRSADGSSSDDSAIVCGGSGVMSVTDAVTACSKTDNNVLYFKFY